MFKELFESNRGEEQNARREQQEMQDIRDDAAIRQEGGLSIARLVIPKLSQLTGKQWGFENSPTYGNHGMSPFSMMTNPGRLRAYKTIKNDHTLQMELLGTALEDLKQLKPKKTGSSYTVTWDNNKFEIHNWGRKGDFKIDMKD